MKNLFQFTKPNPRKWYATWTFGLLALSPFAMALDCNKPHWVTAWESAPSDSIGILPIKTEDLLRFGGNQTFREVFSPLGSGSTMRLRFSNRFGDLPLRIQAVSVAKQSQGAAIEPNSLQPVLFKGQTSISIPAHQDVVSDDMTFNFKSFDKLSVSIAVREAREIPTEHFRGHEYSFVTLPDAGNFANDLSGEAFKQKTTRRHIIIGMDAMASAATSVVVTLGDSITDGAFSTTSANLRYPDDLKRRIDDNKLPFFVANAGIGGNRVVSDSNLTFGPSALNRYHNDVLMQTQVSDVILLEGINDIGLDFLKRIDYDLRYRHIINGYTTLISAFHKNGIKVTQGTLTPTGGASPLTHGSPLSLQLRQDVNWWIRHKSPADVIVDFDEAIRDPLNPEFMDPQYDSGDGLHPNDAGYREMAKTVDLAKLQGSACR